MFWRKEYDCLNKMLDDAIAGDFREDNFDETQLSKVQSKLMRYLTCATMSEKKLDEEKNRLKELITNISHQTKTPLTNILMYSQLLEEQVKDERLKEYTEEILVQGRKLETLIQALVKMSRLETGIFQFDKEVHSLTDIVSDVVNQGKTKAQNKNISIVVGDEPSASVRIDKKWVTEAVYNILDNAIKYSDEGTTITISIFSYEMFSGIRIADQGIGMDEEEIPRVFGRFYRGQAVHDKEGIGVGLFLAREIVEGQGGYIKARSAVNKGSTFDVCFPNLTEK
jgi:signal transduction histidine kinase